jgi:hypothetical protein
MRNEPQPLDSPVEPPAGISSSRERRWGIVGGLVGAGVGVGSLLIAWAIQGEPLRDLSGSPYPPLFTRRTMMPLDYYFLAVFLVGTGFLAAAVFVARRGRYPRSDGFGAVLIGTVLSTVAGLVFFIRLWAALHA